ncbi:hypothetical protein Bca4012_071489 [Brassica carinata]
MLETMITGGVFPENMNKFFYSPSGIVDHSRKDICCDTDVVEMVNASSELESINLFVVRADDQFLLEEKKRKKNLRVII